MRPSVASPPPIWLLALALAACKPSVVEQPAPTGSASARPTPDPCPADQVCVQGTLSVPVCMRRDGTMLLDGAQCVDAHDCAMRETCMGVELDAGVVGYCMPTCPVQDDRPACAAGCYNELCSGTFELCMREQGVCAPVPCAQDSDCASVNACDYPGLQDLAFHCNLDEGLCQRDPPAAPSE